MLSLATGLATTAVSLTDRAGLRGRLCRHPPVRPGPASDFAAAVGAACGGGFRPRLPDCAVGNDRAHALAGIDRLGAAARSAHRQRPDGALDDGRADRQGNPVPAADHACRAAAGRSRAFAAAGHLARLRPHRRLRASAPGRRSIGRSGSRYLRCSPSPPRWSTSRRSSGRRRRRRWRCG